ncbi:MAG: hypothetical protein IKI80_01010, partial [Bacteroidaceae bacterium]|nr:hypothetical protein [Bacteroidaceae bacterium]
NRVEPKGEAFAKISSVVALKRGPTKGNLRALAANLIAPKSNLIASSRKLIAPRLITSARLNFVFSALD